MCIKSIYNEEGKTRKMYRTYLRHFREHQIKTYLPKIEFWRQLAMTHSQFARNGSDILCDSNFVYDEELFSIH